MSDDRDGVRVFDASVAVEQGHPMTMAAFWREVARVTIEGREWVFGQSELTPHLYVFTDILHPDGEHRETVRLDIPLAPLMREVTRLALEHYKDAPHKEKHHA